MFVGIVGGGISGLYTALLLRREGHQVVIFEASKRLGGRIYTHYFGPPSSPDTVFFEAGAMRIPRTPLHQQVYDLVDFLNDTDDNDADDDTAAAAAAGSTTPQDRIELVPYILEHENNLAYVHGRKTERDDRTAAARLGLPRAFHGRSAHELLAGVLAPWLARLRADFDAGFAACLRHDELSFRAYLRRVAGWPHAVVEWVELMTSQTNQFELSFTELVLQHLHFGTRDWATVRGGMARLVARAAQRVGWQHIRLDACVRSIVELPSGKIQLRTTTTAAAVAVAGPAAGHFVVDVDRVVLAVPPAAVANLAERPRWGFMKEQAIRGLHYEPLYKLGLHFRTRFWERGERPSFGGQSTTDLRFRWLVYPSHDLGAPGPGVLLLYAWMTDAARLMALTRDERVQLALHDLGRFFRCAEHSACGCSSSEGYNAPPKTVGAGGGNNNNNNSIINDGDDNDNNGSADVACGCVDVHHEFVEAFDVAWSSESATGDAMFFPGQFSRFHHVAKQREGHIHFAGEHLSRHHTWIAGALESTLAAVRDMLGRPDLEALRGTEAAGDAPKRVTATAESATGGGAPPTAESLAASAEDGKRPVLERAAAQVGRFSTCDAARAMAKSIPLSMV